MKIVITASGAELDAPFESRFGRCPYYIFIETDSQNWEAVPNPAASAGGGAGTQAVQFVTKKGAQAVISGRYGPNAFQAFQAAGVQMYVANRDSVNDVLDAFLNAELEQPASASAPGHRGRGHRQAY
jgi:predicted Fe-Mo cluster-binding NifX family protein